MLETTLTATVALIFSLLATPVIRMLAIKLRIFASHNNRTIHQELIPKLGGLSIFAAFASSLIVYNYTIAHIGNLWSLVIAISLVVFIGSWDDKYNLGCYRKLLGQTLAAVVVAFWGFSIQCLNLPFGHTIELGYWGPLLSVFWILTITNAINLLDGLDGLAAVMSIVIAIFIFTGSLYFKNNEVAAMSIILIAAIIGFLRYNLPPAKIFMGDTGSLFLGFLLACLSLKAFTSAESVTHIPAMVMLFAIPLLDTGLAIIRRLSQGKHPFSPDKNHIHHRLLELTLNQSVAVTIINIAIFVCGLFAHGFLRANYHLSSFLFVALGILVFGFVWQIGCFDFLDDKVAQKKPHGFALMDECAANKNGRRNLHQPKKSNGNAARTSEKKILIGKKSG